MISLQSIFDFRVLYLEVIEVAEALQCCAWPKTAENKSLCELELFKQL